MTDQFHINVINVLTEATQALVEKREGLLFSGGDRPDPDKEEEIEALKANAEYLTTLGRIVGVRNIQTRVKAERIASAASLVSMDAALRIKHEVDKFFPTRS